MRSVLVGCAIGLLVIGSAHAETEAEWRVPGVLAPWIESAMEKAHYGSIDLSALDAYVLAQSPKVLAAAIEHDGAALSMLNTFSRERAQKLQLAAVLTTLSGRVPEYATSPEAQELRGQLALELGDLALARRAYGVVAADTDCASVPQTGVCSAAVASWLATGKVPRADLTATVEVVAVFDERGKSCWSEHSGISHAHLLLAQGNARDAIALKLIESWPALVNGCVSDWDLDFAPALDSHDLALAYQEAVASVQRREPKTALVMGLDLPLPAQECDFAAAPDCSVGKPLAAATAERIVQRLGGLDSGFGVEGGQCRPKSEAERLSAAKLEQDLELALAQVSSEPLEVRATSLAALLTDAVATSGLTYLFSDPLQQLAAAGDPEGAIRLQQRLVELRGIKASGQDLANLGALQLAASQPTAALSSYERAASYGHDAEIAAILGDLRAYMDGAALPQAKFEIQRPWIFTPGLDDEVNALPELAADPAVLRALMGPAAYVRYRMAANWSMVMVWIAAGRADRNDPPMEFDYSFLADALLLKELPPMTIVNAQTVRIADFELPLPDGYCDTNDCKKPEQLSVTDVRKILRRMHFEVN